MQSVIVNAFKTSPLAKSGLLLVQSSHILPTGESSSPRTLFSKIEATDSRRDTTSLVSLPPSPLDSIGESYPSSVPNRRPDSRLRQRSPLYINMSHNDKLMICPLVNEFGEDYKGQRVSIKPVERLEHEPKPIFLQDESGADVATYEINNVCCGLCAFYA